MYYLFPDAASEIFLRQSHLSQQLIDEIIIRELLAFCYCGLGRIHEILLS